MSRTPLRALAAILCALTLTAPVTAPAIASAADDPTTDPNLDQTLEDLEVVRGERVLDVGHVDMGPKFHEGEWRFLIHDDVAKADVDAESVWRYPEDTVFRVVDQAKVAQPDDEAYSFTGAAPGEDVWIVPQTQDPEVVWLGWNTQDPEVMQSIDRGVTLSLTGAQDPGIATVYLQSGTFGDPQVLWDSRKPEAQPLFVDVNTHTHANWVFTEPGVYLLRLQAEADLIDGSTVSDTQYLRFAVGEDTPVADARTATWEGPAEPESGDQAPAAADTEEEDGGVLVPVLIGAIVLVAVALIAGVGVTAIRSGRARKAVLADRTGQ